MRFNSWLVFYLCVCFVRAFYDINRFTITHLASTFYVNRSIRTGGTTQGCGSNVARQRFENDTQVNLRLCRNNLNHNAYSHAASC